VHGLVLTQYLLLTKSRSEKLLVWTADGKAALDAERAAGGMEPVSAQKVSEAKRSVDTWIDAERVIAIELVEPEVSDQHASNDLRILCVFLCLQVILSRFTMTLSSLIDLAFRGILFSLRCILMSL